MAEKLIINATEAALSAQGETTAAWTVAESTGAPTVTEQGALTDHNGVAIMQTGASAAEKAAVAFCILDSLILVRSETPNRQRSRGWGHNHQPIEWSSDGMR